MDLACRRGRSEDNWSNSNANDSSDIDLTNDLNDHEAMHEPSITVAGRPDETLPNKIYDLR